MMTRSEILFERFLDEHQLTYRRLEEDGQKRADYEVKVGPNSFIVEVKQIDGPRPWNEDEARGRNVGEHIRRKIAEAKKQLQRAAKDGAKTILLIFNAYDPAQRFGTERLDFEFAMYGDWTVPVNLQTGKVGEIYHGNGRSLQPDKNTSISALGCLIDLGLKTAPEITLYENCFAKNPIDYSSLPSCFDVVLARNA